MQYNSSDDLIHSLMLDKEKDKEEKRTAQQALHCDAKLKYCGQSMSSLYGSGGRVGGGGSFDVNVHSTIEFRPQSWWIDVPSYRNCSQLIVVCFHDLHIVFPTLFRRDKRKYIGNNMKGYWYVHKVINSTKHREYISSVLYRYDTELFKYYCSQSD